MLKYTLRHLAIIIRSEIAYNKGDGAAKKDYRKGKIFYESEDKEGVEYYVLCIDRHYFRFRSARHNDDADH